MHKQDSIRKKILKQVAGYFACRKNEKFIPGQTRIPYAGRVYDEKELIYLIDTALDFWLTADRYADKFEKGLAGFLEVKYCLLTNSGSSANLLAVSALTSPLLKSRQLKPGDEIITTACGFPTTLNPILQNSFVPVFVDVELGNYNIQADKIEKAITKKTKAIFVAHTLGNPVNIDSIQKA
jgi:CDP-4-dehydro-6-deoxyglucose reductase, E1